MTRIIVDADGCPVTKESMAVARTKRVPVVLVGNSTQNLERHIRRDDPRCAEDARGSRDTRGASDAGGRRGEDAGGANGVRDADANREGFWVDTLQVDVSADSADFAVVEILQPDDVVVTQDIGLAGMVLGRGARAIGVRGRPYDKATIDMQLFIRHEEKKVRRAGGRTKGPSAFTDDDRERFKANLSRMIEQGTGRPLMNGGRGARSFD